MNVIEAKDLVVRLDGIAVLKKLSWEIEEGKITALIGPNGSGKTTFIRTLLNIYPYKGLLTVLGCASNKLSNINLQQIGYMADRQEIPSWMTVKTFLSFCKSMYPTWDDVLCSKMIHDLEIPLHKPITHFSRGMKAKTALIAALAYRPSLLILDEPFSGLDPEVRDEVIQNILELVRETQLSVLISSHDLPEVEQIADSVGFLFKGKIKEYGSLDTILMRFKRVVVSISSSIDSKSISRESWLETSYRENRLEFVESQFDEQELRNWLETNISGSTISSVTSMSLKDIYLQFSASN